MEVLKLLGREAREQTKLSQAAIARVLGYNNGQFISNFERGESPMPLTALVKMADIYMVERNALMRALVNDYISEIQGVLFPRKRNKKKW